MEILFRHSCSRPYELPSPLDLDDRRTVQSWVKDTADLGFVSEWPNRETESKYIAPRGQSIGSGTEIIITKAIMTAASFAGVLVAYLRSKRVRITLTDQKRGLELKYEGPNPTRDVHAVRVELEEFVRGLTKVELDVYAEDLGDEQPRLETGPVPKPLVTGPKSAPKRKRESKAMKKRKA